MAALAPPMEIGAPAPEALQPGDVGLQHLPHSLVALVLDALVTAPPPGAGQTAAAAAAAAAGTRAAVCLAFSSHALLQTVAAAEPLWAAQCERLGWSLAWLDALPPSTRAWDYFCQRMAERHRLRRQLRQLALFLDPLSAAALQPPPPLEAIREEEAALQLPLPWALFELYRFCDGQHPFTGSVQFLDAARLLSLQEMRQAVQERHGPLDTRRAFASLVQHGGGDVAAGAAAAAAAAAAAGGGHVGGADAADQAGSSAAQHGADVGWPPVPPEVLLPFTDELRGRKRYCMDLQGRVWLASGFNVLPSAPSLSALVARILT